ncbi:MAG: adenosine deaminase [Candidatus Aminicenantes bacterium]|nr:MAG: adenosine deaminase [Candidatus Aminicenantes bacterium]
MTWYSKLPKVELHVHLEGAIPHDALFDLIKKYGGDPIIPDVEALARRFKFKNFAQFIEAWTWKNQFLREYEDFSHIAELTARDMAKQNIRYVEMLFSPSLFVRHGLEVQELIHAVRIGLSRVSEIEISLIADLVRDYGPESEMATLKKLNEVKSEGIIGIGLGGSEHEFPPEPFKSLCEEARLMDFHINAHAGEAAGAESIWGAIKHLHVERIGHGTRAHEDPELLDYLRKHRIPLELCPMSNVCTGVVSTITEHPIREYFDCGLIISVNTDDPMMFGNTLDKEYELLVQEYGFTRQEICRLLLLSIESSWLSEGRKKLLVASFEKESSWVG